MMKKVSERVSVSLWHGGVGSRDKVEMKKEPLTFFLHSLLEGKWAEAHICQLDRQSDRWRKRERREKLLKFPFEK